MVIPTRFIVTAGVGALGVGAAGHAGAYTVLDGDSLDGRGLAQGDGLFILQALVGRSRTIHRVEDAGSCRTAHGHLRALLKLGVTAEARGCYRDSLGTTLVLGLTTLRILHVALVARGHALHQLTVAVVAGDVDARALQLILDVHVGHEDHATRGDEVAAHLVHIGHRRSAQAEGCD